MKRHGLGRLPARDLRDHSFLARAALPRKLAGVTTRTWRIGPVLDQGETPMCVGYSAIAWLHAAPVRNKAPTIAPDWWYHECQKVDEWPGEGYEGTSVRASAKVGQRLGYIVGSYLWAFDVDTCVRWLLQKGPIHLGTIWTESMFDPDAQGYIHVDRDNNKIVGGHAFVGMGVDTVRKRIEMVNNWSAAWGRKGRAYISFDDLAVLLAADGEAMCAEEVLIK